MEPAIQVCHCPAVLIPVRSPLTSLDIQRGDLLFLSMPRTAPLALGDITVYKIPGAAIPIVHRVIETHDECVDSILPSLGVGADLHLDTVQQEGFERAVDLNEGRQQSRGRRWFV